MKVLLGECVDWRLLRDIHGHEVRTARQMGFASDPGTERRHALFATGYEPTFDTPFHGVAGSSPSSSDSVNDGQSGVNQGAGVPISGWRF